jgi:hypothetical protein
MNGLLRAIRSGGVAHTAFPPSALAAKVALKVSLNRGFFQWRTAMM